MDASIGAVPFLMQNQPVTPTTGQTVAATSDNRDRMLTLTPAGTLAALTITFPTDAASRIGQQLCITTSQAITALTATAGPTIGGFPSAASANDFFVFQKVAANTWRRRQ
jgi:hypothetical protein